MSKRRAASARELRHANAVNALGRAIWHYYRKRCGAHVANAIKWGKLPHPVGLVCVYCHGPAAVYEHRDYHKPLIVQPACDSCNHTLPPAILDPKVVIDHIGGSERFPFREIREVYIPFE